MIFQKVTSVALVALAASVAAEPTKRFTKGSPNQFGLLRFRSLDVAYEPETIECGEGNTCAEACGEGYDQCFSTDEANHCYKPVAGETCCNFPGTGNSCEAGYFCAHDIEQSTVCCAEGKSLEDCASINDVSNGPLTSDPATPSSTSVSSSSPSTSTSTSASTWSSSSSSASTSTSSTSTELSSSSSSSSSSSVSTTESTSTSGFATPTKNNTETVSMPTVSADSTPDVVQEGAAARVGTATAAALLAAGAFVALF